MVKISFILLHLGDEDEKSRQVINKIEQSGLDGFTYIKVQRNKTKQWLNHNSKKIIVTKFPSFLIAQEDQPTQVFSAKEIDKVLDLLREVS